MSPEIAAVCLCHRYYVPLMLLGVALAGISAPFAWLVGRLRRARSRRDGDPAGRPS